MKSVGEMDERRENPVESRLFEDGGRGDAAPLRSQAQGSVTEADADADAGLEGVDAEVLVTDVVEVSTPGEDVAFCEDVEVDAAGDEELLVDGVDDALPFADAAGCGVAAAGAEAALAAAWDGVDSPLPPPHAARPMAIASAVARQVGWRYTRCIPMVLSLAMVEGGVTSH
jgi:hypothetical protein